MSVENQIVSFNSIHVQQEAVIFPTIKIKILPKNGNYIFPRRLTDSGSQVSLVISNFVRELNLKFYFNNLYSTGISENSNNVQNSLDLIIASCVYDFSTKVKCGIVDKITSNLPFLDLTQLILIFLIILIGQMTLFIKLTKLIFYWANNAFPILLLDKGK